VLGDLRRVAQAALEDRRLSFRSTGGRMRYRTYSDQDKALALAALDTKRALAVGTEASTLMCAKGGQHGRAHTEVDRR
jgi:hypothetical protein